MRTYGFPYKGSKNKIAEKIVDSLPSAKHFYDLFCGGCAITHCAMTKGKYEDYFINDIDSLCPELFSNAVNGKYKNEMRWISRECFFKLKDTDGYVKFCWSFGNNGRNYLYSKEIEPYKKALHYAITYQDYSLIDKYDVRIKNLIDAPTIKERRLNCKKDYGFLRKILSSATLPKDLPYKYTPKYKPTNTIALTSEIRQFLKLPLKSNQLESLQNLQNLQNLQSLQSLKRLQSLQNLQSLQSLERLETSSKDYQDVEIKENSVIYCDIPYFKTDKYNKQDFDYERFYAWCEKQTQPLFISSYEMPKDRFIEVASFNHRSILSTTNKFKSTIEKLFIPKHQA